MSQYLRNVGGVFLLLFFVTTLPVFSQTTITVSGRITDAASGEAVPFVNVAVKGTTAGTVSDAEGKYVLRSTQTGDSLLFSSLGYQVRALPLQAAAVQVIDAVLSPASTKLLEVKVYAKGGDPAYRILKTAIDKKDRFDPSRLSAFEYENYSKVEAYVNNFANGRRKGKGGPVGRLLGKLPAITDENGRPAVPVYVSETVSTYYQRFNPEKAKEKILKTHVTGVGTSDGSMAAQLTGASFQQYNFYKNYLSLLRKDIPSPLGEAWKAMYSYRLMDTVQIGESVSFQIDFEPKRATDLAFNGTIWIDTTEFSLVQVDAHVYGKANINFVDEIRIEQEYEAVAGGHRLPTRTQLLIDTQELTPDSPGALVRFYAAVRNPTVNQPREPKFYEPALELAEDFRVQSPDFWQEARPAELSSDDLSVFSMVDSVRNVPFIKVADELVNLTLSGYYPLGSINLEAGPLLNTYAFNSVEGHRLRLGLRTTTGFSRRWVLGGYLAYGTRDGVFKYGTNVEYIVRKKPWTVAGFQYSYDLERLGISPENLGGNAVFAAYTRFGTFRRPYFQKNFHVYFRSEIGKNITQSVGLRSRSFDPLFSFAYRAVGDPDKTLLTHFNTTELLFETRFAPGELVLQNDNERFGISSSNKPVFTFRYQAGLRNFLHSDLNYHRFMLNVQHSFRMGVLGRTRYNLNAGYIPSTVPYPLLYIPLGNETFFYVENAYNLMNYFEFVCDRYAGLQVEHNFEGLLFNRIPLIRRLKWRLLATTKVLVGSVSPANTGLIPATDDSGAAVLSFNALNRTPYVEVGYGIDNIFKVFRVEAVHRLTYRDSPNASTFGIKVSAWLSL